MTGSTNNKAVEGIEYGFVSTNEGGTIDAEPEVILPPPQDIGKPLPLHLLKMLKRMKIKQNNLLLRRVKNRKRNKQARRSRRINNILKHGR